MEEKKATVVILSRNLSTGLSVIRSLGDAGYTVDLFANVSTAGAGAFVMKSKHVNEAVEVVSAKVKNGEDRKLIFELLKYASEHGEKRVLFPTDDYTTTVVDVNRSLLEPYYFLPTLQGTEKRSFVEFMDKRVQTEFARLADLETPMEWIISLEQAIEIPQNMVYPCFVKATDFTNGSKGEMAVCNDEEELLLHLRKLRKKNRNRSVLVQEFIEIEDEFVLSGVCIDQEVVIPGVIKTTDLAQYNDKTTLTGKIVSFDELDEAKQKIVNMLKSLGYIGLFDMELFVSNNKVYFNEIHLRCGNLSYAFFRSGVNLPALYVKGILGESISEQEIQIEEYGKTFLYEKAAWRDYVKGYITREEFESYVKTADITFLFDDDDDEPEVVYFRRALSKSNKKLKTGTVSKKGKIIKKLRKKREKLQKKLKKRVKNFLRKIKYSFLDYPQMHAENARNPESEMPRVVVIGRNYCSNLCMARGVGKAGYEVEILRIFQRKPKFTNFMKMLKPDAYSKYVKAYRVCISRRNLKIVKALIRMADKERKMLLIPTDDFTANVVDANFNELSDYYVLPNAGQIQGEIIRLMSKEVQKELAREAGLPVLNSCVIRSVCGIFKIPETVNYPCFIKPNISKNSSKTKMRRCDSEEELREVLTEYCQQKDFEMLVEDYVEIGREYSLLGVSTPEGVNGPGFFVAEEGGVKEHRGVALIGKVLPCSTMQPLIDDLIRFIGTLNYTGLYDVDLIETVDGKVYFVELNMRFGGSGYSITESGINLPGMFADYMLKGQPIDLECKLEDSQCGKRFVSEKIMIEEFVKGRLTMDKIKESMNITDIQFVQNADDPRPYKHFKKFYPIGSVLRLIHLFKTRNEEQ